MVKQETEHARYPRPPSPPPLALHILNNMIVISLLTPHTRWHTQEQRLRLVVAKKPVSNKTEQVLRRRAPSRVASLPHPARLSQPRATAHPGAS